MNDSTVYALDFDGVICDSAVETAIASWKAACQLWSDMPVDVPPSHVEAFRQVRPIIETGYEAVLAMRMLHKGASIRRLCDTYTREFPRLMAQVGIDSDGLKTLFGATRDAWIAEDGAGWVAENPLYAGVAEKLRMLSDTCEWYIATTKQERFVAVILEANGIELDAERIYGLDRNIGKGEVLKLLLKKHPGKVIEFVEDRFLTLQKATEISELGPVRMVFALWGYNSEEDKRLARVHGFACQPLEEFLS
jgi:phosphoglycolate phosphatase-like HAD superfamily hydrolase